MAWVLSAGLLADAAAAAAAACMAPVIIGQTFLVKGGVGGCPALCFLRRGTLVEIPQGSSLVEDGGRRLWDTGGGQVGGSRWQSAGLRVGCGGGAMGTAEVCGGGREDSGGVVGGASAAVLGCGGMDQLRVFGCLFGLGEGL